MYQFVKNKLVLVPEQIIIIFLELDKSDHKGSKYNHVTYNQNRLFKYYLNR